MPTQPPRTVVVLGGGTGGLTAARDLAKRLRGRHRVVLVERDPVQHFGGALTWTMVGYRQPSDISRDLRTLLPEGVDLLEAQVEGLDLSGNRVATSKGAVAFDYLVVALGAETTLDPVPGLAREAHTFYHLDGAVRLRGALEAFDGGSVGITVPSAPYRCPAAPYDAAMLLSSYFRGRGIRNRVDIQVYTLEPAPLPVAGPAVSATVLEMLKERGVAFNGGFRLKSVDAAARHLCFENLVRAHYDMVITVPVHRPPAVVKGTPLAGPGGWIPVDSATLRTLVPNVFAIGDATVVPILNGKFAVPKAGAFAHAEGETVAANLAAELLGKPAEARFEGEGGCFLSVDQAEAALIQGSFLKQPAPEVSVRPASRVWHAQRALLLSRWQKGQF